jgi:pre-mRNA-splicing factor CWC22
MSTNIGESSGIYIPPFKLARMSKQMPHPHSEAGQRLEWERLRKAIRGHVNRVNGANIKEVAQDLFVENLVRGRGLFARSIIQAQVSSPMFSNVFAALVAIINSKFPNFWLICSISV